MFLAKVTVDVPDEVSPGSAAVQDAVERIASRRETVDDELTQRFLGDLSLFEHFLSAFAEAGFDDVVSVAVDGRQVYLDVDEQVGDLREALEGTVHSGAVDEGFSILRVTFSRVEQGLRILGELRCRARVEAGVPEVTIRISAREMDTDLGPSEGPREYAARVRTYIHDASKVAANRQTVEDRADALVQAIGRHIAGAKIAKEPVRIRIVACGPRQVGRMRHLGFTDTGNRTVRCGLPDYERTGAYDDPLTLHYYSPYQDLFDWIALGEILDGHWAEPDVEVLHPTGRVLMTGDQGQFYDASALEVPRNAVRVDVNGRLVVDASVPHVEALTRHEGGPHSPGWAGEEWTEHLDDEG